MILNFSSRIFIYRVIEEIADNNILQTFEYYSYLFKHLKKNLTKTSIFFIGLDHYQCIFLFFLSIIKVILLKHYVNIFYYYK
jgi:hypothetical protein